MFGRKRAARSEPSEAESAEAGDDRDDADHLSGRRFAGPWDSGEVDLDTPGTERMDLGSLLVTGVEGVELRLQADQATGAVTAVLLASGDGAVELRPFAAPKSGGLWDELRGEIAAEATRLGGTVDEDEGPYGPQLRLRVPAKGQGGRSGVQVSRVVAVEGPRWLLRATFVGTAAQDPAADASLEQALRDVVVVRGEQAMRPREPLPLRLPPQAQAQVGEQPAPTGS
jgi:hypothetical protein